MFGFEASHFALLNMVLALVWLGVAMQIGRRYVQLKKRAAPGEPPRLLQSLQPQQVVQGVKLRYQLPENLFLCEPGDVLDITVRPDKGNQWPQWLTFDADSLRFHGTPPDNQRGNTWFTVRATNIDGQWVETRLGFILR
jgi:hypothetical protein